MNKFLSLLFWIGAIVSFFHRNEAEAEKSFPSVFDSISDSRHSDVIYGSKLELNLQYNFYRNACPNAEQIVHSTMSQIFSEHKDAPAALLRLLFHDCFIQGCDASVLLDDDSRNRTEKHAIPNRTLKGFDKVDMIKEQLEKACPGVVSCADILVLASRDGIVLSGGPFYPVFTGRRDSIRSFYMEAMAEIPKPDGNISQILQLFADRGFNEREIVSLLGAHNIGKISCEFIQNRLYNFMGMGKPDPNIAPDFLNEMSSKCNIGNNDGSPASTRLRNLVESASLGMRYRQGLSASMASGSGFDTHYYRSLLRRRGLLYSDQQLMADERTARLVRDYASDDGSTFRTDFARVMVKLSNLQPLTGSEGQVRLNCSVAVGSN